MDIDKVNDEMQEAWEIGDWPLLHGFAGDMVDEIRRLIKVIEWMRLPEGSDELDKST